MLISTTDNKVSTIKSRENLTSSHTPHSKLSSLIKKAGNSCVELQKHKNIIIKSLNPQSKSALLLCHGGYTPNRGRYKSGSGITTIPEGISMQFNCTENNPSIGTHAYHLLNGEEILPHDVISEGSEIKNYSLEHDKESDDCMPNEIYDIILIKKKGFFSLNKKTHMSDVFEAIDELQKKYTSVHSFACRINKVELRANQHINKRFWTGFKK